MCQAKLEENHTKLLPPPHHRPPLPELVACRTPQSDPPGRLFAQADMNLTEQRSITTSRPQPTGSAGVATWAPRQKLVIPSNSSANHNGRRGMSQPEQYPSNLSLDSLPALSSSFHHRPDLDLFRFSVTPFRPRVPRLVQSRLDLTAEHPPHPCRPRVNQAPIPRRRPYRFICGVLWGKCGAPRGGGGPPAFSRPHSSPSPSPVPLPRYRSGDRASQLPHPDHRRPSGSLQLHSARTLLFLDTYAPCSPHPWVPSAYRPHSECAQLTVALPIPAT